MAVTKEVQDAVDRIRKDKDLIASMRKADEVRDQQLAALQAQIADLKAGEHLSEEDKRALADAVSDARDTHDELQAAVPANTDSALTVSGAPGIVAPTPLERDPDAERADPLPGTGQNGTVPLMPNSAFDPDPTGSRGVSDGQPNQPRAIETAGGFVVAGGGSVARAPGSDPASPSSSIAVPAEAVAAADVAAVAEQPVAPVDAAAPAPIDAAPQALAPDGQPAIGGTPVPDGTPMPAPNHGADGDPNQKAPA